MLSLQFARAKLDRILVTIEYLKAEDFPYQDSREALGAVEGIVRKYLEGLSKLNEKSNPAVVQTVCQRTLDLAANVLPVLGLITRSTDVRNPLEVYGPLLRLTYKAIGPDAKLVISSEWDFSPFTLIYPELFKQQFVLVGLPISESTNALVLPLAGHELGHNIWANENLSDEFDTPLENAIVGLIRGPKWTEFSQLFSIADKKSVDDLATRPTWSFAWQFARSYCEELFCDFVGLHIFRESFLYAFAYLLAPSARVDRSAYPSALRRAAAHVKAAKVSGIEVPDQYEGLFLPETNSNPSIVARFWQGLAEAAAQSLEDQLAERARILLNGKGIGSVGNNDCIDQILACFKRGVPCSGADITSVINAAWKMYLAGSHQWEDYPTIQTDQARSEFLNELVLKSFEISEIKELQTAYAAK